LDGFEEVGGGDLFGAGEVGDRADTLRMRSKARAERESCSIACCRRSPERRIEGAVSL